MKFALIDGNKAEATKGAKGVCPCCGSELIAKCGEVKVNHWAHKKKRNCDPWWENETEWHRSWKNNFPNVWQEFTLTDEQSGEKHIADIRTSHSHVIEFQHSHINPQERTSRENFYKDLVWVVNGTRLKRDYPRFLKGMDDLCKTKKQGYYIVSFPDECFPSAWLGSIVPVIFDFKGTETIQDVNDKRNHLYCLLPQVNDGKAILIVFSRESFIQSVIKGELFKKQQEPQMQIKKPPTQNNFLVRRREPTHYYDPRKGRFVRRRRL